jgi:UDP-glucose 4-epimerase
VEIDIENTNLLVEQTKEIDSVIHLASNPDIARAAFDPRIDFVQGTVLTESVIETCRINNIGTILYASGSGVYGDAGSTRLFENSLLCPISTYGASKLAGETLLSSYSYMFGIRALAFRFANVVGPMQTHGVGFDFLKKLKENPKTLTILGDGRQSKSYVYVTDIVEAVLKTNESHLSGFDVFNISTNDSITVTEIADLAAKTLGLAEVKYSYTGGDRGWKADVPIVRLDSEKIRKLGWSPKYGSYEAIAKSLSDMR